jgi:hypothetical protein
MKLFELEDLTEKEKTWAVHYFRMNEKLKSFQNSCTIKTFQDLFGEKEGTRLWESYAGKCDKEIIMFLTYLTGDHKNTLFVNLIKYDNLAKEIL